MKDARCVVSRRRRRSHVGPRSHGKVATPACSARPNRRHRSGKGAGPFGARVVADVAAKEFKQEGLAEEIWPALRPRLPPASAPHHAPCAASRATRSQRPARRRLRGRRRRGLETRAPSRRGARPRPRAEIDVVPSLRTGTVENSFGHLGQARGRFWGGCRSPASVQFTTKRAKRAGQGGRDRRPTPWMGSSRPRGPDLLD